MNRNTVFTIAKGVIIVAILLAVVFALRAPAADLNYLEDSYKGDYVDSTGLPYFSEMDSYFNLRMTQDYVDHGYAGDEKVNGTPVDMHRNSPDGLNVSYDMGIIQVTSLLHDLANKYFGDYSVKEVAFWAGAIVSCFAVIPAYIFSRRLSNDYGAIVATLIIVLAPNYFAHTFPGFFDTDMFYYIFSLFFVFFFVEALRADRWIFKIVFTILAVISIGLFSQQWSGYVFYVALMGLFAVVYLIMCYIFNVGDNQSNYSSKLSWFIHQKDVLTIIAIGIIAFAGLIVMKGVDGVVSMITGMASLLSLQSTGSVAGGFPNVLISVAEMQMPSLLGTGMNSAFLANTSGVVNGMGGIAILFAALAVLYILVSRTLKFRHVVEDPSIVHEGKPDKSKRLSASKKLDDSRKFKLKLTDLKFGGNDPILENKRLTIMYTTLFVVWVLVTVLAVSQGSRFTTTIVLPFALLTAMFVRYASDYIKDILNNDKLLTVILVIVGFLAAVPVAAINMTYGILLFAVMLVLGLVSIYAFKSTSADKVAFKKYLVVIFLVIALVSPSVCGAYQTADNVVPGTSDAMWNAMKWIDETQDKDTVITSWWDFGYLFEIAADRQVTFDGGSQSGERAFWLGQAMTTDNLELSAGIFRMLDTTGDRAVQALGEITGDNKTTTDALIKILPKTSSDAKKILVDDYNLTTAQAKKIVSYTHPKNPRPVIFVASSDMLQKAGWWSYFGAWDFKNQSSQNYNYYVPTDQVEVKKGQTNKLSLLDDGGMTINAVISRGNGNNSTTAHTEAVYSDNGSQIYINNTPYNPLKASKLIIVEDGYIVKNESIKGAKDGNYTLFITGNGNSYTPILISNELANSMFTKLYLLGGANQDIFEPVHSENGVMLFKVNFDNTKAGS